MDGRLWLRCRWHGRAALDNRYIHQSFMLRDRLFSFVVPILAEISITVETLLVLSFGKIISGADLKAVLQRIDGVV